MAIPPPPDAAPQSFSFAGKAYDSVMIRFSGHNKRRLVSQEFLNRGGGRVEDREAAQRRLDVAMVFTGPSCATDYNTFKQSVRDNPRGLLTHPIAGQWAAFCEGPDEEVDFSQALDRIAVNVGFLEDDLDAQASIVDVPDVSSAAQTATTTSSSMQQAVAEFMGAIAKAQGVVAEVQNKIDDALAQVALVSAPIDFLRDTIRSAAGVESSIVGTITGIATAGDLLAQEVDDYVTSAAAAFNGNDTVAGFSTSTASQLDTVTTTALALEDLLMTASPTPAGSADAVGGVEETLAACYVLDAAVKAAKPPLVDFTVTRVIDVITLAKQLYPGQDPLPRAAEILGLNRIPNPAAIRPGVIQVFEK